MFFDSVNTFSTRFPEYENRAAFFAKPATPIQPKGSFLREHEYQRNPFALPGFSFETREPPPLGLPSDRLANILKERKKTPSEIREIVQTIVNGPQPDTSSPFQYFLWAMSMEMKKPALNYPNDVILKLISDLVIAQPQILEKIPTPSQIRNREVYLENIPPFLLDVQGNLTTKLPPLDEYKLQFEGKDVKEALIGSTYGDKPAVDSKGNRIQVSATADDGKEYEMDVFTFDPSGGKSLPPSFTYVYMNYDVIDPSFLSLVNFDDLPQNEALLLDLFEYVFVPSNRNAPEEIAKPPFRAILQANDSFLGNLLLGMAEDDRWLSLYLNPARPLKNRTQFCKAFFLEAIQYFINQSSKPQFMAIYRHFYSAISALNFELPYTELIARLQAMYSDLFNELQMPKHEDVGSRAVDVAPIKEEKHGAFAPPQPPSRRGSVAGAPVGAPAGAPSAPPTPTSLFSSIKTPTTARLPSLSTGQLVSGILPAPADQKHVHPAGAPSAPPTPTSRRGSIAGAPAGAPSGSLLAPTRRRDPTIKWELKPREAYDYVKVGKMDYDNYGTYDKKLQKEFLDDFAESLKKDYGVSALQREWTVSSITRDIHFNLLSEPENVLRYVLVKSGVREEKQIKQTTRTELEVILQNVQYGNYNKWAWIEIFKFLEEYDTLNELKADVEAELRGQGLKKKRGPISNVGGRGRKKARNM